METGNEYFIENKVNAIEKISKNEEDAYSANNEEDAYSANKEE